MQYEDPGAEQYEQRYRERVVKQLQRRAAHFGFSLQPVEAGASEEARGDLAQGRGRMIGLHDRQRLARDIQIAQDSGARLHLGCQVCVAPAWGHDGAGFDLD